MPICSYLVSPVPDESKQLREELKQMKYCAELKKAENRELYVLVTETENFDEQLEMEEELEEMSSIDWLVQSFGELDSEAGQVQSNEQQK